MAGFPIIAHHFKGDKKKALTLTGEARRFLHQVETYERQPYFKRTEKLIDGSTITVQRLENGQYLSFINTFIEEEILEEDFRGFLTGVQLNPTPYFATNDTFRRKVLLEPGLRVNTPSVISVNAEDLGFEAGNIDWIHEYTWQGPITRDGYMSHQYDGLAYRNAGNLVNLSPNYTGNTFPNEPDLDVQIKHRYEQKVYNKGKVILDLSENISDPTALVIGYARGPSYHLAITWKDGTSDQKEDTVWMRDDDDVWTDLGQITYVDPSDSDYVTLGRGQCITFNKEGTKFTGVVMLMRLTSNPSTSLAKDTKSILLEGEIVFSTETGLPTGITITKTETIGLCSVTATEGSTFTTLPTQTTQKTKLVNRSADDPLPICSAYKDDGTLAVMYADHTNNMTGTINFTHSGGNVSRSSLSNQVVTDTFTVGANTFIRTDTRMYTDVGSTITSTATSTRTTNVKTVGIDNFVYVSLRDDIFAYEDIGETDVTITEVWTNTPASLSNNFTTNASIDVTDRDFKLQVGTTTYTLIERPDLSDTFLLVDNITVNNATEQQAIEDERVVEGSVDTSITSKSLKARYNPLEATVLGKDAVVLKSIDGFSLYNQVAATKGWNSRAKFDFAGQGNSVKGGLAGNFANGDQLFFCGVDRNGYILFNYGWTIERQWEGAYNLDPKGLAGTSYSFNYQEQMENPSDWEFILGLIEPNNIFINPNINLTKIYKSVGEPLPTSPDIPKIYGSSWAGLGFGETEFCINLI